jgi:hypothetical protein
MTGWTSTVDPADLARWRWLFIVAALYDMALGVAFFFFGEAVFEWLGMTPPPHISYIQLPAIFVFVQGVSYALVAAEPLAHPGIVWIGIVYKLSYALLAAWYLVTDQIPAMFFAWFGLFDFVFFLAFVWYLRWLRQRAAPR